MNINGASRRSIKFFARHFEDREKNERVELVEVRGLSGASAADLLHEMRKLASLAPRCQNFFYHVNFNPCPHERPTEDQWQRMYEIFEQHRGIPEGAPRFVYEHRKNGRTHRHAAYLRVDLETLRAFPDGLDWKVCHTASRAIERELGLQRVVGPLDRPPGTPRPKRAPKSWEMFRGGKTGIDPREVTKEVTALFRQSENAADFVAELRRHGYELVRGNRAFCILDPAGDVHSLARRIENVKTKELKAFMRGMDLSALPTVEETKTARQRSQSAAVHDVLAMMFMPAMQPTAQPRGDAQEDGPIGIAQLGVEPEERQQGKQKHLAEDAAELGPLTVAITVAMRSPTEIISPDDDQPATVAPILVDAGSADTRRGFAGSIKQLFRDAMRRLTLRPMEPKMRRKKTEETRGAFKLARQIVLRVARRMPIMPIYQAELWQWNNLDTGHQAMEEFSYTQQNPLSPHL